jgi:uncharacterized protein
MRACWRALLFVTIFLALQLTLPHILGQSMSMDGPSPLSISVVLRAVTFQFAMVALTTLIMARIDRRSVLSYGFTGRHKLSLFVSGLAIGIFSLGLLVLILWRLNLLEIQPATSPSEAISYAFIWGLAALIVGLSEEALFRGYLQYVLAEAISFRWAAVLLSILFAIAHAGNSGESPLGFLELFLSGALACLSLWYTRSLFWVVGLHAGWDWAQSFVFGTPDSGLVVEGTLMTTRSVSDPLWSGGADGPEGSVLIIPLYFAIALGMWVCWGRRSASRESQAAG